MLDGVRVIGAGPDGAIAVDARMNEQVMYKTRVLGWCMQPEGSWRISHLRASEDGETKCMVSMLEK